MQNTVCNDQPRSTAYGNGQPYQKCHSQIRSCSTPNSARDIIQNIGTPSASCATLNLYQVLQVNYISVAPCLIPSNVAR